MFTKQELQALLTFLTRVQLSGQESIVHATLLLKIQSLLEKANKQ